MMMAAETVVNSAVDYQHPGANQTAPVRIENATDDCRYVVTLGNLGGIYRELGDAEKAYDACHMAADIFQSRPERALYGESQLAMGYLLLDSGEWSNGATTVGEGRRNEDKLASRLDFIKGIATMLARLTETNNLLSTRS